MKEHASLIQYHWSLAPDNSPGPWGFMCKWSRLTRVKEGIFSREDGDQRSCIKQWFHLVLFLALFFNGVNWRQGGGKKWNRITSALYDEGKESRWEKGRGARCLLKLKKELEGKEGRACGANDWYLGILPECPFSAGTEGLIWQRQMNPSCTEGILFWGLLYWHLEHERDKITWFSWNTL